MNVLVTGGTGTLGRDVVMLLRQSGHRARILSRNPRGHVDAVQGDVKTGAGQIRSLGIRLRRLLFLVRFQHENLSQRSLAFEDGLGGNGCHRPRGLRHA